MAKVPNTVIGIDLGRFAIKTVQLQKRGDNRYAVTHYANHLLSQPAETAPILATELKAALKEMGGNAKHCVVSVSSPEALIRILDQPETPTKLLRDALRLNGMALLNQDCRDFVLDCDQLQVSASETLEAGKRRYLVGGLPRGQVTMLNQALSSAGVNASAIQLAPVSLFNAFEFARPEVFASQAFFLVDIGFLSSTMTLGSRRELVLVRSADLGGHTILESLCALSGETRESVMIALEQEDEHMVENARVAMVNLTREITSSIGFFEGRREETVSKIFVSGGVAKAAPLLRVLSDELRMPCESWNALVTCENALPQRQKESYLTDMADLHVASGAAAELFNP